jgi:hypothetical protein
MIETERGQRLRAEEQLESLKTKLTARDKASSKGGNRNLTTRSGMASASTKAMMTFKEFKEQFGSHHDMKHQWQIYKTNPDVFTPSHSLKKSQKGSSSSVSLPQIDQHRVKMKKGQYVVVNGCKLPIKESQIKLNGPIQLARQFGAAKLVPRMDINNRMDTMRQKC